MIIKTSNYGSCYYIIIIRFWKGFFSLIFDLFIIYLERYVFAILIDLSF